jgi:hypothetical protein
VKSKFIYVLLFALIVCGVGAFAFFHSRAAEAPLSYWQRQATKVYVGMTRDEAEKILPPQNFDGVIWRIEDIRQLHAPRLPKLKEALRFHMVHSNFDNLMGYEVCKGVFVTIRYDLAGLIPGPPTTGKSTVNPGDRVITVPVVTDTTTGERLFR